MNRTFFTLRDMMKILFIIIIPILAFFLTDDFLNYLGKVYLVLILLFLFISFQYQIKSIINFFSVYSKKKQNNSKSDTLIIIGNNDFFNLKFWFFNLYNYDFFYFFKYLDAEKIKYNVYNNLTKSKFKKLIENKKFQNIYLFAHGSRHEFNLFEDNPVYYCEFDKSIQKKFIAQYHCNHNFGTSLGDNIFMNKKDLETSHISNETTELNNINTYFLESYLESSNYSKLYSFFLVFLKHMFDGLIYVISIFLLLLLILFLKYFN